MPKKKYEVLLTAEDKAVLKSMTHSGNKYSAREILHAQVLLHSNDSKPGSKTNNRELAAWLDISPTTVNQIRRAYSENGLEAALHRKTRITPAVASKSFGLNKAVEVFSCSRKNFERDCRGVSKDMP